KLRDTVNLAHARDAVCARRSYHRAEIGEVEAVRIDLRTQRLRAAAREPARRHFEIRELQTRARYLETVAPGAVRIQRHRGSRRLVENRCVRDPGAGQVGAERNCEFADVAARGPGDRYGIGNRKSGRYMRSQLRQRPDTFEQDRIDL